MIQTHQSTESVSPPGSEAGAPPVVPRAHVAPPRILVWVAAAVVVAGAVMVLVGAWRVGISTDEPVHVMRYSNLEHHGWYLLDDDFDGSEPGAWVTDKYVYGAVATQLMHGVGRIVGVDPAGGLGTSVSAYTIAPPGGGRPRVVGGRRGGAARSTPLRFGPVGDRRRWDVDGHPDVDGPVDVRLQGRPGRDGLHPGDAGPGRADLRAAVGVAETGAAHALPGRRSRARGGHEARPLARPGGQRRARRACAGS